jgi:predicted cupin superfamily sugar epimerase
MHSVKDIVHALQLEPHPEGGFYRRTYKNQDGPAVPGKALNADNRGHASAIYYLQMPEFSLWHRTDGDELWFWHAGAPLKLEVRQDDESVEARTLGPDFASGQAPQLLAPANKWQRAKSLGNWTLVSCSVSPGFLFETYELEKRGISD